MKRITILAMLLVMCSFISKAQSFKVYLNNGTNVEYNTTDVDSITICKKTTETTNFYYGSCAAPPSTVTQIQGTEGSYDSHLVTCTGTPVEFYVVGSSSSTVLFENNKCLFWFAIPSGWSLKSWKDVNSITMQTISGDPTIPDVGYRNCVIGTYTLYYYCMRGSADGVSQNYSVCVKPN